MDENNSKLNSIINIELYLLIKSYAMTLDITRGLYGWFCWGHDVHPMAPCVVYITKLYKFFNLPKLNSIN